MQSMKPFIPLEDGWSNEKRTLEAALEYAKKGWRVFPCHIPTERGCSCGRPDCSRIGKHPKTRNGFKDATTDVSKIERWFGRRSNLAIATGSGLLVLDIDPGSGGEESLQKLEEEFGALPDTLTCRTGSGGAHYYFIVDIPVPNSGGKLGEGIDIRGDGGYVIAPPSLHKSGKRYEWTNDTMRECPQWLLDLCLEDSVENEEVKTPDGFVGNGRNNFLTSQAGSMRRRGMSQQAILAALFEENKERCKPPLPSGEVVRIAKSISKYEPEEDPADWKSFLKKNSSGVAKPTPGNCVIYLTYMDEWKNCICYNEFTDEYFWSKQPPESQILRPNKGDKLEEAHTIYVSHWMAKEAGPVFNQDVVWSSLKAVAKSNKVDPVKEWMNSIQWDGKPRVDTWMHTYLGAKKKDIIKQIGRWWLIGAVARVFEPGCQVDHTLVLEGAQGVGKSQAARILGGDYYLGTLPSLSNQYASLYLQGFWIVEIPELSSFKGANRERVKEFLTQVEDVYKRPYDKVQTRRKRRCTFLATTNLSTYLEDHENRRYWPVKMKRLKRAYLIRDREQLFAEAVYLYKSGEPWHPDKASTAALKVEQEERHVVDAWEVQILTYLKSIGDGLVTTKEILTSLGFETSKIERRHQMRCGDIVRRLGWINHKQTFGGVTKRGYIAGPEWIQKMKESL